VVPGWSEWFTDRSVEYVCEAPATRVITKLERRDS
jgi:hypothetical protein